MFYNEEGREKAILVGVHRDLINPLEDSTEESMRELESLAETAGAEVLGHIVQNKDTPEKATYVGEGKLLEIKEACESLEANLVIADDELTGVQLRNLEEALGVKVIDRSALILDIFAGRARSGEGKLQVELAQLKYNLPRLAGGYAGLSRLGGGIGTRGPGETKLESDRRHIRTRIHSLEREIEAIKRHRDLIRERRKKDEVPIAALVGYTNAGKSTLLNFLTNAGVLAEDMLFATLDPTARAITLPDGRQGLLIDTVGFIRKLPHHLIEAFKSTLEEAVQADVLLHIIDASSDQMHNQTEVVQNLLSELGCNGKPIISVYNKCDEAGIDLKSVKNTETCVYISAKTGENTDALMNALDQTMPGKRSKMKVLIPYTLGKYVNEIQLLDSIISESYEPEGTLIEFMADATAKARYKEYEI